MTLAVEPACEVRCIVANGRKALVAVPVAGDARIDVGTERVVPGQVATHALQIKCVGAGCCPKAGNHRVVLEHPIRPQLGAEVCSGGQIDLDTAGELVGAGITRLQGLLTEFESQLGAARAVHRGVDVDVVLGNQRQLVGAPVDAVIDVDIAGGADRATGTQDADVTRREAGAECRAGHVAAAGGNREIDRVDQPGAGAPTRGSRGDLRIVGNCDVRSTGLDKAAIACPGSRGIEHAADLDTAGFHVAHQHEGATTLGAGH